MSTWNYRVLEFSEGGEVWQEIHEVYNDDDGAPRSYGVRATVHADCLECPEGSDEVRGSLEWTLDRMREALDKPVLRPSDFQNGGG